MPHQGVRYKLRAVVPIDLNYRLSIWISAFSDWTLEGRDLTQKWEKAYLQLHRVITNSTVELYSAIFDAIALGIKRLVGSDEQLDKTNGDSWVLLW